MPTINADTFPPPVEASSLLTVVDCHLNKLAVAVVRLELISSYQATTTWLDGTPPAYPLAPESPSCARFIANRLRGRMFDDGHPLEPVQGIKWTLTGAENAESIIVEVHARDNPLALFRVKLTWSVPGCPSEVTLPFHGALDQAAIAVDLLKSQCGASAVEITLIANNALQRFREPFLDEYNGPYRVLVRAIPRPGAAVVRGHQAAWLYLRIEEPVLFGPEMTVTNELLVYACHSGIRDFANWAVRVAQLYQQQWLDDRTREPAGATTLRPLRPDERTLYIVYDHGWYYEFHFDDAAIEITTCPMTLIEAAALQHTIQTQVFATAKGLKLTGDRLEAFNTELQEKLATCAEYEQWAMKLPKPIDRTPTHLFDEIAAKVQNGQLEFVPNSTAGSGHIHIDGCTAFQVARKDKLRGEPERVVPFLNFIIDFQNHPSLCLGGLGWVPFNPTIAMNAAAGCPEASSMFAELVRTFKHQCPGTIREGCDAIIRNAYNYHCHANRYRDRHKYQAVNLLHIHDPSGGGTASEIYTIEIRCIRPQQNAADLFLFMELLDGRIRHILSVHADTVLDFNPDAVIGSYRLPAKRIDEFGQWADAVVRNKMFPAVRQRVFQELHHYVCSAGLDWNKFKAILLHDWLKKLEEEYPTVIDKL